MLINGLYLNGCAVSYPETRMSVSEALSNDLILDFDESIGNPLVPVFEGGRPVADLAVEALRETLKSTGADAAEIGLLLHCGWWHQGFDMWSAAHYVARQTGALNSVPVNISQGCNAPMAALELACKTMLSDGAIKNSAVTASDAMQGPQLDRWNLSYGCVLGDAGTALVVSREPAERNSFRIVSIASKAAPELEEMNRSGHDPTPGPGMRQNGLLDLKASKKAYLQEFGLNHFTKLARESLMGCIRQTLDDAGLTGAEASLRTVALPRLSGKSFETVYRPQLSPFFGEEKLWWLGGRTAHLGVADVGANIADIYQEKKLQAGELCVIVNAGGGYTWTCLVLELTC